MNYQIKLSDKFAKILNNDVNSVIVDFKIKNYFTNKLDKVYLKTPQKRRILVITNIYIHIEVDKLF